MKTILFDTETTGFAHTKKPFHDPAQPYLMQLAYIVTEDGTQVERHSTIIHCPREPHEKALAVHGITSAKSWAEGINAGKALDRFHEFLTTSDQFICHNTSFDRFIMQIAYVRAGLDPDIFYDIPGFCTMKTLTNVVRVQHPRRDLGIFKWPTLQESYKFLVNPDGFSGAHDALNDVTATFEVFNEIHRRSIPLAQVF